MKINSNISDVNNFLNRNFKGKERPILQLKENLEKKMPMTTSSNIENTENNIKEKNIKGKKLRPTTANISSKLQNNLKENIPTEIKEEFQKEIKKEYNYDDSFFDEDENNDIVYENSDEFLQKQKNDKYYPHVDSLMRHYVLLNVKKLFNKNSTSRYRFIRNF